MARANTPPKSNGTNVRERVAAQALAEANVEHKTFKGATVTKSKRGVATLVTAEGEEYNVQLPHKTDAFAIDGSKVLNATLLFQNDNVVDVTIVYVGPRPPPWKVTEIHLVRGTLAAPASNSSSRPPR